MNFDVEGKIEIAIPKSLDIEGIKRHIKEKYMPKIEKLKIEAIDQVVGNDAEEKDAIEKTGQTKKLLKAIETQRKEAIKEPDEYVRGINSFCKSFKDSLSEIERLLKKKISDYGWQKEIERRKKEKEVQEEARKLQEKINTEAEKAGIEPPKVGAPAPMIKEKKVVRTESGTSSHLRTEFKLIDILDFALVPDDYKVLDKSKVRAAIKAGIREIPGLKIEEVPTTIIRP